MNRKSRTAACRSPEQTRPRLLTGCRVPAAAACSHVAAGSTRRAPLPPDQGSIPLVAPRSDQPGRPSYEWIARSAQTRAQDRQDHVRHERDPPSGGETQANTVGVFWASVAPLAKASGCPPIRVNPNDHRAGVQLWRQELAKCPKASQMSGLTIQRADGDQHRREALSSSNCHRNGASFLIFRFYRNGGRCAYDTWFKRCLLPRL